MLHTYNIIPIFLKIREEEEEKYRTTTVPIPLRNISRVPSRERESCLSVKQCPQTLSTYDVATGRVSPISLFSSNWRASGRGRLCTSECHNLQGRWERLRRIRFVGPRGKRGGKKEEKIKKIEIPPNDDDITTLSRKCCLPPLIWILVKVGKFGRTRLFPPPSLRSRSILSGIVVKKEKKIYILARVYALKSWFKISFKPLDRWNRIRWFMDAQQLSRAIALIALKSLVNNHRDQENFVSRSRSLFTDIETSLSHRGSAS